MCCIGRITVEYRDRMYALLGLYDRPYIAQEPEVGGDEKSRQLRPCNHRRAAGPACP